MEFEGNKHYIKVDGQNRVIRGFSDAFEQPQDNDITINENGGRQFKLFGQVNPTLFNGQGIPLYKYDERVRERTIEEIQIEIDELELLNNLIPTQKEVNKAIRTIETIELLQELEVV